MRTWIQVEWQLIGASSRFDYLIILGPFEDVPYLGFTYGFVTMASRFVFVFVQTDTDFILFQVCGGFFLWYCQVNLKCLSEFEAIHLHDFLVPSVYGLIVPCFTQTLCKWLLDQAPLGHKAPRPSGIRSRWCPSCAKLKGRQVKLTSRQGTSKLLSWAPNLSTVICLKYLR